MKYSGNKINKLVLVSTMGLVFVLTGCGGGGGGSSPPPASGSSAITGVTVGGTAAKGIIKGGVVTAEELNGSGVAIATVGNATTGSDGSYSLTLNDNYNGGPIQISITADANTQTKCDAPAGCGTRTDGLSDSDTVIDFGEFYKPAALTMTALVPVAASNETLSVSVTPFTHMAATRARAAATLDAAAISNANSEVSNLLGGLDILNTPPVDITDSAAVNSAPSATAVTYAALASALSNQGLVDANGQPDLNAAISLLANSFVNGIMEADDAGGDDASQISLQDIVTAAEETFTAAGVIDTTGKLDGMQSGIDFAEAGDGTINPEPSTTVADPTLDKVKAMMSDVRTWGNVIQAEAQAKGSAFEVQVTMASDAVNFLGTNNLNMALNAAIDAAFEFSGIPANLSDLPLLPVNNFTGGTIDSPSAGVVVISDGIILGYTVNMTIKLPEDLSTGTNFNVGIQSASIVSPENTMTINSGLVDVTFVSPYQVDYAALDAGTATPAPDVADLTLDMDVAFTQKVDSGGTVLASPVTFAGTMAFDLDPVPLVNDVNNLALPRTFDLTGTISSASGGSFDASLVANVSNTGQFQFEFFAPEGALYSENHGNPFLSWTYTDTDATAGDDTFTYIGPDVTRTIYWNANNNTVTDVSVMSNGTVYGGSQFGLYTTLADYLSITPINNVFVEVAGEGKYFANVSGAIFSADGTLDGVLMDPSLIDETASNFIDADVGLTFMMQLTGLPVATVNITADRTGFEAGTGTVTISYGTRQLVVSGSVSNFNAETGSGTLIITNQDSVVFNLALNGTLSGNLTFNGVQYATIIETASGFLKISYTDGTFEIF